MAGKKSKSDLESLRSDLNELTEAIYALREHVTLESAATAASRGVTLLQDDTRNKRGAVASYPVSTDGGRGEITISGAMLAGDTDGGESRLAYQWDTGSIPASDILSQDFDALARTLAAIGHRQRLAILNAILSKPSSAADLVSTLKLGTTGAAYHHLNVLQAAELVTQEERGIFAVHPQRVGTLLTILASASVATTFGALGSDEGESEETVETEGSKRKSSRKKSGD